MNRDLVYGRNPVLECLRVKRRRSHVLTVQAGTQGLGAIREAAAGLPIETLERRELDRRTRGGAHQGVLLEADPVPLIGLDEWLDRPLHEHALIVLLDGVTDPQNFGAIVRSAVAIGAQAVIFPKDRSVSVTPAATKAAAGAMEHVNLIRVTNLVRTMDHVKQHGFWLASLDPDAETNLWDADLTGRLGVVVGSEGKGLRRLVLANCDLHLRIPLPGPIPSLNASVSAAIALAECLRQRTAQG